MTAVVLADTGPLYALVDRADGNHERARRDLARLEEEATAVAALTTTVMEAYSLTLARLGTSRADDWLRESATGLSLLHPTEEDFEAARARALRSPDQRITLFDAVMAEVSRTLSVSVWTFDHHFDVMGSTVWR